MSKHDEEVCLNTNDQTLDFCGSSLCQVMQLVLLHTTNLLIFDVNDTENVCCVLKMFAPTIESASQ